MRLFRQLYLTRRTFRIGWVLVLLLAIGWLWRPVFVLGKLALLFFAIAICAELYMLYGRRTGITAARRTLERWSNGDINPVTLIIRSNYALEMRIRVLDELPFQFQERGLVFHAKLPAWSTVDLEYNVRPVQRGVYVHGAIQVFVSSVLGLVERRFSEDAAREVAVYPSYLQLRKYELLAISDRLTLAGIKKVRHVAQHAEFERIREYIPGDDRRTVNWKATARRGRMMVNQYQDESAQQVFSLIDTGRVMKMPFDGLSLLDHAINASLVISSIAMHKEDKAGIITFSDKVHDVLPPSRQKGQMQAILQLLYAQQTGHKETDFERAYIAVRRHIHQRSLLLLFTNYESVTALKRQLPYLQRIARQHLLIPIFFINTELEDELALRPRNTEEVYIRTTVEKMMYEKKLIARELQRQGMPAILCRPQDLTVSVIDRYLELKARGKL